MNFLRNIPWYAAYAALFVVVVAAAIALGGALVLALKVLGVAGVLLAFAVASWYILEGLGVL